MTYSDIGYLFVFLPLTILLYSIFPKKHKWKVLLVASYIFFWSISSKLIVYLIGTTILMHYFGLWINTIRIKRDEKLKTIEEKEEKKKTKEIYKKKQKRILILSIAIQMGILLVLKYSGFICENLNIILTNINLPFKLNIGPFLLPIGISFYSLQAVAYMVDVYNEKIKVEDNLGKLALFISFFPQIMEGPICRYSETAAQLWKCEKISYTNLTFGLQRILFGLMKKIIIADRLNVIVGNIFNDYANYDGGIAALGMILYTLQLYTDFSGVMDIVIGTGEIFGKKLPENFRQPFFSKTISDFWTRWHITLGAWLRDYIYYPVSLTNGAKKLTTTLRKKVGNYYGPLIVSTFALFLVWIFNGAWHGSAWTFIVFGMYHFVLILLGRIFEPLFKKIIEKLHINKENFVYKGMQIIRTTILVFFGELIFRANNLTSAFQMIGKIFTNFTFNSIGNGSVLDLGLDLPDFIIVAVFTFVIFIISILKENKVNIRQSIANKKLVIRWIIYYALILSVVLFGAYGEGYKPVDPMYAQF